MTRRRPFLSGLAGILLLPASALALEPPAAPQPGARWGYVSDFAGVLTESQRDALEARLRALDASDSTQVAVVTLESLEGDSIEDFANRLFRAWGIGRKAANNGALLLVAVKDRETRIEVGYGLEGRLTDAISGMIIRDQVVPRFREGDYAGGIRAGAEAIAVVVRGEYQGTGVATPPSPSSGEIAIGSIVPLIIILLIVVLTIWRLRRFQHGGTVIRRGRSFSYGWGRIGYGGGPFRGGGFGGFSSGGGGGFDPVGNNADLARFNPSFHERLPPGLA